MVCKFIFNPYDVYYGVYVLSVNRATSLAIKTTQKKLVT